LDIKWKNKPTTYLLLAAGFYLLSFTLFCAVDIFMHQDIWSILELSAWDRHQDAIYYSNIGERLIKEMILGTASLAAGVPLLWKLRKTEYPDWMRMEKLDQLAVDARVILLLLCGALLLVIPSSFNFFYIPPRFSHLLLLTVESLLLAVLLRLGKGLLPLLRNREDLRREWEKSLARVHFRMVRHALTGFRPLLLAVVLTGMTGLAGVMAAIFLLSFRLRPMVVGYLFVYVLVFPPLLLHGLGTLQLIFRRTGEMAGGNLNLTLEERGSGPFAGLVRSINNMKSGYLAALEERVKSERLKTELITNVSHDLKTPLTSIVNYVDLLQTEGLPPETQKKYLEVLTQKTQRLKILIDDLFEASKMASGAVELQLERIDVTALLEQAIAEFSDRIAQSSLGFRIRGAEAPLMARLDGRQTWRVFENLIGNALKYSQPGTRVYLELEEDGDSVSFTMKNISAYEIDFDAGELMERFKRGDASRSTEGSGLGLAIARSIVELQGGTFRIELDGDVFKVLVRLPKW
jgi:signal transduction histidine kinase